MLNLKRYKPAGADLFVWTLAIVGLASAQTATANGWEHTSVPISALAVALEDKSADIRQQAAFSMGYRHHSEAGEYLIQRLAKGEADKRVRQTVYQSLGKLGSRNALDHLSACLKQERQALVRASCAGALGNIGGNRAEMLAMTALDDEIDFVAIEAIRSLGSFSSDAVNQTLFSLSKSEQMSIKLTAIEAMGKNANPLGAAQLVGYIDVDTPENVLVQVLQAIARIAGKPAKSALEILYRDTQNERVRRYALFALSSVKAEDIVDYAMQAVESEDIATRLSGLSILREMKSYGALPGLIDAGLRHAQGLYERPQEWFIAEPSQALLDLSLLIEYLRTVTAIDPVDGYELYELASTKVELPRSSPVLVKISEGFYQARWQATYAIGYARNPSAEKWLKKAAVDSDPRIRSVALRSIGVLGAENFKSEVNQALIDEAAEVRWVAASVVGRMDVRQGEQRFDARLIKMLKDTHNTVRKQAALSLAYLGSQRALESLQAMAKNDTDTAVREAAEFSVSLIRGQ